MTNFTDEDYERVAELKEELAESARVAGFGAWPSEIEGDILIEGGLKEIFEWALGWRSEIEELW